MFFKLAHTIDDRFPVQHHLGKIVLNVDSGWHTHQRDNLRYVFKGYVEDAGWSPELLAATSDLKALGNFCVFCFDTTAQTLSLKTNRWRGMIVWNKPGQWISNLDRGSYTIWNDSSITVDQDLSFLETKVDIIGDTSAADITPSHLIDRVHQILDSRIGNFLHHNTLPVRVFCSGGIDSTLVWSFIKRHTLDYELVLENRVQWDYFWCRNRRQITQQFWAYQQIHHWLEPCVLTSGAPGDEFFFRSPVTVNLWCMYNNIDIFDLLRPGVGILYDYFMLEKNQALFRSQQSDRSLDEVMRKKPSDFNRYLCDIVVNDCQHWHLGNTLTFTPLRDLEIFKLFLNLSPNNVFPQIFNGDISRALIARNDPTMLDLMSDVKNVGESLSNLARLVPK
jgi:hypothetical protein